MGSLPPSPESSPAPDDSGLPESPEQLLVNPFAADVCAHPFAVDEDQSVPDLNYDVLEQLATAVDPRAENGQPLVLLTSPRAGYGKTHLMARMASMAGGQIVFVSLAFRSGDPVSLAMLGRRGVETMSVIHTERKGWSHLREACAGVCCAALHRLIAQGALPCANPEQAQRVLAGPPAEVFDDQGEARLIGDWLKRHLAQLRKPVAGTLAAVAPLREADLDAWTTALLNQAAHGGFHGVAEMVDLVGKDHGDGCLAWFRLLALWRPVVLLVDHLDAYYRNTDAGLRIAALLLDMADQHGVQVVMSLNQDVWQATFGHHLPGALEDRLTAAQVLLRGLSEAQALDLVRLRMRQSSIAPEMAAQFENFLNVPQFFLGRPLGSVAARAFLRHAAQQWQAFVSSMVAAPPEIEEATEILSCGEEASAVPLKTETVALQAPLSTPTLFDPSTGAQVKRLAEGLTEPRAALPQDEAPLATVGEPEPTPPPAPAPADPAHMPDAFEKLREMLDRLRQPGPAVAAVAAGLAAAGPAASAPAAAPAAVQTHPARDVLLGRFEALRLQMSAEAESKPLDHTKLAGLIRLAGRRFPLVRFSEHELPGLTGRFAMCWSLNSVEIVFGLANFADLSYWRTLACFAAGRQENLEAEAAREGFPAPRLKLVSFTTEREQEPLDALLAGQVIPESLRDSLDIIRLDSTSIAALYAMQRIIKEAESGTLTAAPSEVMSVLARELDFFWKRVTRTA